MGIVRKTNTAFLLASAAAMVAVALLMGDTVPRRMDVISRGPNHTSIPRRTAERDEAFRRLHQFATQRIRVGQEADEVRRLLESNKIRVIASSGSVLESLWICGYGSLGEPVLAIEFDRGLWQPTTVSDWEVEY